MTSNPQTSQPEPATSRLDLKETEAGSVFVSNYPPYSFWSEDKISEALAALNSPPLENTLGLYLHIPFCRKRCKFCYFRVYTDKNASQIDDYLNALAREVEIYSQLPAVADRPLKFVYIGGGTPSFISIKHLRTLVQKLKTSIPWDGTEEVTFECEPGTLSQSKLEAIREIGVTRLSLGIENFNDFILKENGRAHLSKEIFEVMPWINQLDFDQLNIDLIAGMVGETWESWKDNVQKTIDLNPDSVTIYQMELPFNTVYTKELGEGKIHVADWQTKRDWNQFAFEELAKVGYEISSAYTMVKKDKPCKFVYRDSVWQGTDMLGTGVASFGHMSHVHIQNTASWDKYVAQLNSGELPLSRAFVSNEEERLTREMILQLKLGKISTEYFQEKFGSDIQSKFSKSYQKLEQEGMVTLNGREIKLTPKGLLQVDSLLPEFYEDKYQNSRYT
ncbi:coproporphyrinogen III oxidase family protein [candidate division KSB1 bacterium]|nr:coproporphyrinogen III oxidase family protein [candidate division KSB1 bacterium]